MFRFDVPSIVIDKIRRCDRKDLLDKLIGISLCPEYHANHLRISTLIQVALVHAKGQLKPTRSDLVAMLNGLKRHDSGKNEDPAEDVFVSAVSTKDGQYRLFTGLYPANDFSLQRLLDAIRFQDFEETKELLKVAKAALAISEEIASRTNLPIHSYVSSNQWRDEWQFNLSKMADLGSTAHISFHDLERLGVALIDLAPFVLASVDGLLQKPFGHTALSRMPFIAEDKGFLVPIPSLISPALRLYLADAIAGSRASKKIISAFHSMPLTRWLALDFPLRNHTVLPDIGSLLPSEAIDLPAVTQAIIQFDEEKFAHLLIVEADWSRIPDISIHETKAASPEVERQLADHIRASYESIRMHRNTDRGMTLVVYDSPGWNLNFSLPADLSPHWFCFGLHSKTMSDLLSDTRFSLLELWKMLSAENAARSAGVRLVMWPDLFEHWSVWLKFDSGFWPKMLDLRTFGSFAPGSGFIAELMADLRQKKGAHAAELPSGDWCRVERWISDVEAPKSEFTKTIYMDPVAFMLGDLQGVVESEFGVWWLTLGRPPVDIEEQRFFYLIWQGLLEWLLRIARTGAGRLATGSAPVQISFLPVPKTITDGPAVADVSVLDSVRELRLILPESLMYSMAVATNEAELMIVSLMLDGLFLVNQLSLAPAAKQAWIEDIFLGSDLKMVHVTQDADAGLALDYTARKTPPRLLQDADRTTAEQHLRDLLAANPNSGVSADTERISGETAAQQVLHAAVVIHGTRSQALLSELDRGEVLSLLCRLIEGIHRDRVEWERGARSRTLLYSSDDGLWAEIKIGKRDNAFHVYRVAVEMALCASPTTGGRRPGIADIDRIAGEIQELIYMGRCSDGVKLGVIEPIIDFRPDGGIQLSDAHSEFDMNEYTAASLAEVVALDVDAYPKLFFEHGKSNSEELEDDDDSGVLKAFEAEFGLSLMDCVRCVRALQEVCVEENVDVLLVRLAALEERVLATEVPIRPKMLGQLLKSFGLLPRDQWQVPPKGFALDDVMPWFFERRLSLMLRPVLITSSEEDPILTFGVRQLAMSLEYAAALLEKGIWRKEKLASTVAQSYVVREVMHRSDAFEAEIAKLFTDASWTAFAGRTMRSLGAPEEFGDLDVLAVKPDRTTWMVIECKWFGAARTPREVANWLQDFRGDLGDKLFRHLRRYAWVCEHTQGIATILGTELPKRIEPKIVTPSPVPLSFLPRLPPGSEVWTRRELRLILGL